MPHAVSHSVDDFLEAVAEAVAIVLVVSLVSLGVRTGMVVVISIPIVLAVTALCMYLFDIGLHKVSLGTLILALGLLVDDAIIAVEMMAVKLEQGWNRTRAAAFAYTSTAFPMLTGTLVTVAGFLPIALAKSSTGEYTRSIFEVSAIALIASWLAAVVLIPLLGYTCCPSASASARAHLPDDHEHDIYDTTFYRRLRGWVGVVHRAALRRARRSPSCCSSIAMAGFTLVPQQFFPSSDRPELLVDVRLQEGASFEATLREAKRLEKALEGPRRKSIMSVSFVGTGAPRFYLPLDQQLPQPNFAQFVITAKSVEGSREARALARTDAARALPRDAHAPVAARERAARRLSGAVPRERRRHRDRALDRRAGRRRRCAPTRARRNVQFDWDEPSERSVRFEIDQKKARELGVTSQDVSSFLAMTLSGYTVTQYRERDKLISVDLRAPRARARRSRRGSRRSRCRRRTARCRSARSGASRNDLEYGVIWERDRQPTITVQSDVHGDAQGIDVTQRDRQEARRRCARRCRSATGSRSAARSRKARKGQTSINAQMPIMVIVVLTLLMIQLQSFARVMMVVLTAPLGLIGVVAALLAVRQAVRLRRDARRDRDVRHHHAQLGDSRRSDRAGHRRGAQAFRCDRRRDGAALPADHADGRRRRARADSAVAQRTSSARWRPR